MQNNVDGATPGEAHELLTDEPPSCISQAGATVKCSVLADYGIRSGIYELEEMARIDRRFYCQSPFIKELFLEKPDVLESECRAELLQRKAYCEEEVCPACTSQCTSSLAETIAGVLKCTMGQSYWAFGFGGRMGFLWSMEVSDQGQLAMALHGADRGDAYIAVPEKLAADAFHRFHWNPEGYLQRDAISCRLDHSTSSVGHFAAGFSEKTGNPIARTGYHVPCRVRCPRKLNCRRNSPFAQICADLVRACVLAERLRLLPKVPAAPAHRELLPLRQERLLQVL